MSTEIRNLIADCVHHAIEGDDGQLRDSIAWLARAAGVPYDAVECRHCGGWANAATAHGARGLCGGCDDFNGPAA